MMSLPENALKWPRQTVLFMFVIPSVIVVICSSLYPPQSFFFGGGGCYMEITLTSGYPNLRSNLVHFLFVWVNAKRVFEHIVELFKVVGTIYMDCWDTVSLGYNFVDIVSLKHYIDCIISLWFGIHGKATSTKIDPPQSGTHKNRTPRSSTHKNRKPTPMKRYPQK